MWKTFHSADRWVDGWTDGQTDGRKPRDKWSKSLIFTIKSEHETLETTSCCTEAAPRLV